MFDYLPCLTANVQGLVSRKKLTQDKAEKAVSLLKGVLDYSEFKDVDLVIEVHYIAFKLVYYCFPICIKNGNFKESTSLV